ncbi:MAG: hypothetical protein GXP49_08065 [Deltaproteobacteria bacterium]|nr:hypothetical protein [Deltaproteobacteria bacterium]
MKFKNSMDAGTMSIEAIEDMLEKLEALGPCSVLIGVTCTNSLDTVRSIDAATKAIEKYRIDGRVVGVECTGRRASSLAMPREDSITIMAMPQGFRSRGWAVAALMDAAARMNAILLLMPNDPVRSMVEHGGPGEIDPAWISRIVDTVGNHGVDLAWAHFDMHPLAGPVDSLLAYPMFAGVFDLGLKQSGSGLLCMSSYLARKVMELETGWCDEVGEAGFEPWLGVTAMTLGIEPCEVSLGPAVRARGLGKLKLVFRQVAHVLFTLADRQSSWWTKRPGLFRTPAVMGVGLDTSSPACNLDTIELEKRFRLEFNHFDDTMFRALLPGDLRSHMEMMADDPGGAPGLTSDEWLQVLEEFLLAYSFDDRFHPDDVVDGLFPLFLARLRAFASEIKDLEKKLCVQGDAPSSGLRDVAMREAEHILDLQAEKFVSRRTGLKNRWLEKQQEEEPYLPLLGAWQFVPNVSVIVPQELVGPQGKKANANEVYKDLLDQYRQEFRLFSKQWLHLDNLRDSAEILRRVHDFMKHLEQALDSVLLPGDLTLKKDVERLTRESVDEFSRSDTFQLTPKAAASILRNLPPPNLLTAVKCADVSSLLEQTDPNTALGMAAWTDRQAYLNKVMDLIEKESAPYWFHVAPLGYGIIDPELMPWALDIHGTAALARLAGRVVSSVCSSDFGGEFPKSWFLLRTIKKIVGIELFSEAWRKFAMDGDSFGAKLAASIRGHWGRRVLSAHNVFESRHQRMLAARLKDFVQNRRNRRNRPKDDAETEALSILDAAMDVYHLSITLRDQTFVPLSIWTWSSYSHRGGTGAPTPLSSLVERDWATRDFLTSYIQASGIGDEAVVDNAVFRLMGQGREHEDLGNHLLGTSADPDNLLVIQSTTRGKPASKLERLGSGPILRPIAGHSWESTYVLNAAAVRLNREIYILYRAFGDDKVSRIGLAWTRDGVNIDGRIDEPVFSPGTPEESAGCEDPRVTVMDGKLHMVYTAWDGRLAQIAVASIDINDFLDGKFDKWKRWGLAFPGLSNKDGVLYPARFSGSYVVYHRLDPNLWISYLQDLECPWPRTGQKIVAGPRPGMMWDGVKIGAGAPPVKTELGWLNLYHGVDYERYYRLGVMLMDANDPSRVIYRSPNPVLEPEMEYEIGNADGDDYWVPRVVFTCGMVPMEEKDVLGPEDSVLVYYGAADTLIGVARGKVKDLVRI